MSYGRDSSFFENKSYYSKTSPSLQLQPIMSLLPAARITKRTDLEH